MNNGAVPNASFLSIYVFSCMYATAFVIHSILGKQEMKMSKRSETNSEWETTEC